MTKQEIEANVRAVTRTCRGPFLLPEEVRADWTRVWQSIEASGNFAAGIQLKDLIEKTLGIPFTPVANGDWESLLRRVASLLFAHTENCGCDFNDTICATPFDGEIHEYTCPKCGVTGTFKAPRE